MKTNEDWDRLIKQRIKQVEEDTSPLPASTIKQPDTAFAQTVDHTLLKPDATRGQVDQLCDEALEYNFKVYCCLLAMKIGLICLLVMLCQRMLCETNNYTTTRFLYDPLCGYWLSIGCEYDGCQSIVRKVS